MKQFTVDEAIKLIERYGLALSCQGGRLWQVIGEGTDRNFVIVQAPSLNDAFVRAMEQIAPWELMEIEDDDTGKPVN